jgi:succinyl-CoA synthetase beta subunit
MNIHEYQAKQLLSKYGAPISQGVAILSKEDIDRVINETSYNLYVVKAQIHAGGRGKAGGVKLAKTKEDAKKIAHEMWGINLVTEQTGASGQKVQRLYIESGSDIDSELYLSVILDRKTSRITFVASTEGGVNIEEVAHNTPEKIGTVSVDPAYGLQDFHIRLLSKILKFKGDLAKQFASLVKAIYKAFVELDAFQIEINPLIITTDQRLVVLDAKMIFDDNALFRHAEVSKLKDEAEEDPLETRAIENGLSYVKMEGNIGCMVNGAGLAMATMDIIKLYGGQPANFLDVGGGATKDRVTEALKIILSDSNVKAILVNIFGGIMKCDIIAEGIISAAKEVGIKIPLIVRLAGTNFELGKKILNDSGLKIISADDLSDAAKKAVASIS